MRQMFPQIGQEILQCQQYFQLIDKARIEPQKTFFSVDLII